jgi:cytochrome b involved in lipid metabolism
MKKLTYTAFVAFCASVATLLIVAALAPERPEGEPDTARYTLAEIGEHAFEDSCWIAVEGGVYDVTEYLSMHPTRRSVLLEWCGREATEGMRTKGYGRDHSAAAWASLENFRIGTLDDR